MEAMNETIEKVAEKRRTCPQMITDFVVRQQEADLEVLENVAYPPCGLDDSITQRISKQKEKLAVIMKLAEENKDLLSTPMTQVIYRTRAVREQGPAVLTAIPSERRRQSITMQAEAGIGEKNMLPHQTLLEDKIISGHGIVESTPDKAMPKQRTSTPLQLSDSETLRELRSNAATKPAIKRTSRIPTPSPSRKATSNRHSSGRQSQTLSSSTAAVNDSVNTVRASRSDSSLSPSRSTRSVSTSVRASPRLKSPVKRGRPCKNKVIYSP
ncbi:uncharacterized protein [Watersipora subatra]|uniref:uncharacterized protein n=1 Tax=Watersipora subatra TaxID=2589382 RepID=UPI00355C74F9